jgi:pimeloyl-ACP methyl ester carboxylesterase
MSALAAAAGLALLAAGCTSPPAVEAQQSLGENREANMSGEETLRSEGIELATGTGVLFGTLSLPAKPGPVPVVLIIAGSGPTDRDGNSTLIPGSNDSLELLAEGLAGFGIAALRYDKRGIAASRAAGADESKVTFDSFIDDAVGWIKKLQTDSRFSSVGVIGHSEGSLIGMTAAYRAGAAAFVSIAGAGKPLYQTILEQLRVRAPAFVEDAGRIISALRRGESVPEVKPELQSLFRPSVHPFLISLFRYDPAAEIAKLEVPVLVVNGTHDLQVSEADARLLAAAQPSARLGIVEGMNHVLKQAPADPQANFATYGDPTLPLDPALLETVGAFLQAELKIS